MVEFFHHVKLSLRVDSRFFVSNRAFRSKGFFAPLLVNIDVHYGFMISTWHGMSVANVLIMSTTNPTIQIIQFNFWFE